MANGTNQERAYNIGKLEAKVDFIHVSLEDNRKETVALRQKVSKDVSNLHLKIEASHESQNKELQTELIKAINQKHTVDSKVRMKKLAVGGTIALAFLSIVSVIVTKVVEGVM